MHCDITHIPCLVSIHFTMPSDISHIHGTLFIHITHHALWYHTHTWSSVHSHHSPCIVKSHTYPVLCLFISLTMHCDITHIPRPLSIHITHYALWYHTHTWSSVHSHHSPCIVITYTYPVLCPFTSLTMHCDITHIPRPVSRHTCRVTHARRSYWQNTNRSPSPWWSLVWQHSWSVFLRLKGKVKQTPPGFCWSLALILHVKFDLIHN